MPWKRHLFGANFFHGLGYIFSSMFTYICPSSLFLITLSFITPKPLFLPRLLSLQVFFLYKGLLCHFQYWKSCFLLKLKDKKRKSIAKENIIMIRSRSDQRKILKYFSRCERCVFNCSNYPGRNTKLYLSWIKRTRKFQTREKHPSCSTVILILIF